MTSPRTLKSPPSISYPFPPSRSDTLTPTQAAPGSDPRATYLTLQRTHTTTTSSSTAPTPPPLISSSPFIPFAMITHLMRRKKDSAISVKFQSHSLRSSSDPDSRPDEITNMEGALHTFVTPLVPALLFGDYRYGSGWGGHGMVAFPPARDATSRQLVQQARPVILSAAVQPDFEGKRVMHALALCALHPRDPVQGIDLGTDLAILDVASKQDGKLRQRYDAGLRAHMVHHLTAGHSLPTLSSLSEDDIFPVGAAELWLKDMILGDGEMVYDEVVGKAVRLRGEEVLSLELLFNMAVEQARNEISGLGAMFAETTKATGAVGGETAKATGYILTIDPPSIFAREVGATFLNRLQFAAYKWLADGSTSVSSTQETGWEAMKAIAFNDYADSDAVFLLKRALQAQPHVKVIRKAVLFPAPKGLYIPLEGLEDAVIVVHNNSDAFGQNIESENAGGSLDGAIGAYSTGAASFERERSNLLDHLM